MSRDVESRSKEARKNRSQIERKTVEKTTSIGDVRQEKHVSTRLVVPCDRAMTSLIIVAASWKDRVPVNRATGRMRSWMLRESTDPTTSGLKISTSPSERGSHKTLLIMIMMVTFLGAVQLDLFCFHKIEIINIITYNCIIYYRINISTYIIILLVLILLMMHWRIKY